MRSLGDSEKPQTRYDPKTVAEDIYQLIKNLVLVKSMLWLVTLENLLHILYYLGILKKYGK